MQNSLLHLISNLLFILSYSYANMLGFNRGYPITWRKSMIWYIEFYFFQNCAPTLIQLLEPKLLQVFFIKKFSISATFNDRIFKCCREKSYQPYEPLSQYFLLTSLLSAESYAPFLVHKFMHLVASYY